MSGLNLIASYPRSGNTWVRALLTALMRGDGSLNINALEGPIASDRSFFDDALEVETSDLLPDEQRRLRPLAHRAVPPQKRSFPIKTHDAWLPAPGAAEPPFPREAVGAVVLIIRDPRDVAPSFATYYGVTVDEAIAWMVRPELSIGNSTQGLRPQLPQLVSSWTAHTASWLDSGLNLTRVRYEDLLAAPLPTFTAIARAFGQSAPPDLLASAIDASRFDRLQAAETREGFRESSPEAPNRFFGAGTAGGWRQRLTAAQANRILRDHGPMMRDLGYED